MKTKITSAKKNVSAKASAKASAPANEYATDKALLRARISGIALKASTARNGGVYEIKPAGNGTSTVLSSLFASAFPKKEEVPARSFGEALSALFSGTNPEIDKKVSGAVSAFEKASGKTYKNLKTLRSRISGEIRSGNILSFRLINEASRSGLTVKEARALNS